MPTIKYNGFQLRIRTNDHQPPHVHVIKDNGELVFSLGENEEHPHLERVLSPMKRTDARNALNAVEENKAELLDIWRAIHER